jgi:ribose transport system substrate-binding protein
MLKKKIYVPLILTAVTSLALSGCSTTTSESADAGAACENSPVEKILFDYPFTALPVFASLVALVDVQAAEQGIEVVYTNDDMDLAKQVTNLNSYLNDESIDAVVSFPVDPASLEGIAKQYMDACTYWVSYGGDLENQDASLQFSFEESGRLVGEHAGNFINDRLGGTAKVLILGDKTIQLGQERTAGLIAGLMEIAPDAEIVAQEQAITPDQGLTVTAAALAKNPDIDIVLAAAGDAAQGAFQALVAAGRSETDEKVYVGGVDPNAFLIQAMLDGKFSRSLANFSFGDLAKSVVDVPIALGQGDSTNGVDLPAVLLTVDSPDLKEVLAQLGG